LAEFAELAEGEQVSDVAIGALGAPIGGHGKKRSLVVMGGIIAHRRKGR
jgi:hypothetical protein